MSNKNPLQHKIDQKSKDQDSQSSHVSAEFGFRMQNENIIGSPRACGIFDRCLQSEKPRTCPTTAEGKV